VQQQQPPPQQGKPQLPKSQMPDLGRPTKSDDAVPLFNFEQYFVGRWAFEWEVPDGIFGPAGSITGTTIYKHVDGPFFEAETNGKGPDGPFTIKEQIAYRKESKAAARYVTDSRGFSFMQIAPVGGDLGGYFSLYFESSPFTYKGKALRIKHG